MLVRNFSVRINVVLKVYQKSTYIVVLGIRECENEHLNTIVLGPVSPNNINYLKSNGVDEEEMKDRKKEKRLRVATDLLCNRRMLCKPSKKKKEETMKRQKGKEW